MKKIYLSLCMMVGSLLGWAGQPYQFLSFDGVDDYAKLNFQILNDSTDFTVELFFKSCGSSSNQKLIDAQGSTVGDGFDLRLSSSSITLIVNDGSASVSASGSTGWALNEWNHVAYVHTVADSMNYVYLNGKNIISLKGHYFPDNDATIGRSDHTTGAYFKGFMDDVRFSDTALYVADFTVPSLPLSNNADVIALYTFDETANASLDSIFDSSTNNYDLVAYNGLHTRDGYEYGFEMNPSSITCAGQTTQLILFGPGTPNWTPPLYLDTFTNDTVISSTTIPYSYYGSVLDSNGCAVVLDTFNIVIADTVKADFSFVISGATTVDFTNLSTNASSYAWDFQTNMSIDSMNTNPTFDYGSVNTYSVTLISYNACFADTVTKVVDLTTTGIAASGNATMNIFSANGQLTLNIANASQAGNASLIIYDITGKAIYSEMLNINNNSFTKQIPVANLSQGVYFVSIRSQAISVDKKFIKD